jgi:apolipoprotein N-acyltransferase
MPEPKVAGAFSPRVRESEDTRLARQPGEKSVSCPNFTPGAAITPALAGRGASGDNRSVGLRSVLARPFRYPVRWLAFLAGAVPAVLVFPGPSLSYLAWFALVPGMVLFTRARTTKEAFARGWWFGAGYLIAILQWMAPEIGPGVVLIGAVFGCMWTPFSVAVRRLMRPPVSTPRALAALLVVPSAWLIPEWIRSYQGLGGPWGLYGASQWQHPAVLALAAIGGAWLVSVALLLANAGLLLILGALRPDLLTGALRPDLLTGALRPDLLTGAPRPDLLTGAPRPTVAGATGTAAASTTAAAPTTPTTPAAAGAVGRRVGLTALGAVALVAAAGSGPLAFALTPSSAAVRQVSVALVQPGVVNNPQQRVDASLALTAEFSATGVLARDHPNLIVWGESSVAYDLTLDRSLLQRIEKLSAEDHAEILASQDSTIPGPSSGPGSGGGQEKVAVLVSPAGIQGEYVKTRLVPFGEYIPFRQQLGWLARVSKAASSNMIPGTGARTLTVTTTPNGKPLTIGVLICFESAFPDMSRVETGQGAQLIVYQSATSTFQGTWGPDQHASYAALRAAETGRPVVQAALTGDTVAFDARGRELAWLGQQQHGVVTVHLDLPAAADQTFYDQAGDYVMWTGVAITGLAALVMLARWRGFLGNNTGIDDDSTAECDADTGQPVRT